MIITKNIAMMRRKVGTTQQQFREYYEEKHVPFAMNLIGKYLIDYRRNYLEGERLAGDYSTFSASSLAPGGDGLGPFDAVSEYWYEAESMGEVLKIVEQQQAAIVADEENFMDRSSLRIFSVNEALTDISKWR